jgi:hypothetical protein
MEIRYVKGASNGVADAMSRWAYPAGCGDDKFFHGTDEDDKKMSKLIDQERAEERGSKEATVFELSFVETLPEQNPKKEEYLIYSQDKGHGKMHFYRWVLIVSVWTKTQNIPLISVKTF